MHVCICTDDKPFQYSEKYTELCGVQLPTIDIVGNRIAMRNRVGILHPPKYSPRPN
jgi:hypothetical protein